MRHIFLIVALLFMVPFFLPAQNVTTVSEMYTIGFNDAYNLHPYKTEYDINKHGRKLGRLSQKRKLTQDEIDFIDKIADYNDGYLNGLYEKYRLNKDTAKVNVSPVENLEGDFSYTQISVPLKEELTEQKKN